MDCFCLQNLIAGLTLGFSSTTWKRISTWTLYLQRKSRLQIWRRKKFPNNFHRRAFGCQSLFSWTLKRSWTPKMTPRLLLWQGEMFFLESVWILSPGEILHTQKANTLCWITSTSLRWHTNMFVAELSYVITGKKQPNHDESGLWCSLALWIWHALVSFCNQTLPKIKVLICWLIFVF